MPLPDVGQPLIPSGPQVSPGAGWANRASDIGSRLVYGGMAGLVNAAMAPGLAYQSTQPISTDQMIAPANNLAGLLTLGAGAAPAEADALRMGIKAYHGSPHDFDAFDMSKIGTGEGAQAYGHGLYFAENPSVAEDYAGRLVGQPGGYNNEGGHRYEVNIDADPSQFLDWDKPLSEQPQAVQDWYNARVAPGLKTKEIGNNPSLGPLTDVIHPEGGSLGIFTADKLPDVLNNPAKYAPTSGMDVVRNTARPSFPIRDNPQSPWKASNANSYDEALAMVGGDKSRVNKMLTPDPNYVTQTLRDSGIPGIKYLDQGSRASGEGSHNYVVFDPAIISILRKYGLAALPAAGVAAEAANDDEQKHAKGGVVRNPAVQMALKAAMRARGGKVHVGPIVGNRPGRTDVHPMKVPDGAYVLSADVISHLGQSNTAAGLKVAQHLFGEGGELDTHERRKSKASGTGKPVECITAGGEFVVPPSVVASIGDGDMETGHRILDRWSMDARKDHIKTLARLPPPAQD